MKGVEDGTITNEDIHSIMSDDDADGSSLLLSAIEELAKGEEEPKYMKLLEEIKDGCGYEPDWIDVLVPPGEGRSKHYMTYRKMIDKHIYYNDGWNFLRLALKRNSLQTSRSSSTASTTGQETIVLSSSYLSPTAI